MHCTTCYTSRLPLSSSVHLNTKSQTDPPPPDTPLLPALDNLVLPRPSRLTPHDNQTARRQLHIHHLTRPRRLPRFATSYRTIISSLHLPEAHRTPRQQRKPHHRLIERKVFRMGRDALVLAVFIHDAVSREGIGFEDAPVNHTRKQPVEGGRHWRCLLNFGLCCRVSVVNAIRAAEMHTTAGEIVPPCAARG